MPDPLRQVSTRRTVQTRPADPRQVKNTAGGYTFTVNADARLHRFLTLGSEGGTFYASERDLTFANADIVLGWARERATQLVDAVLDVSENGRAPRQQPALFALAAAASLGDEPGRIAALRALTRVARTGTALFTFVGYARQFRGWGSGLKRAIGRWYLDRPVDDVAYQAVKYRQREGWTHRDVLRLAHPKTDDPARDALFQWITAGEVFTGASVAVPADGTPAKQWAEPPNVVKVYEEAQRVTKPAQWVALIESNPGVLSWEMLPDEARTHPKVWHALINTGMPQGALLRQLPTLTRLGVIGPKNPATTRTVAGQLADRERLRRARIHPINVLVALRTYASGFSARGSSAWTPNASIVDALDAAFYAAYAGVTPAGKRTLLALDVSGSMGSPASGMPISCREVCAALAMVTAATEEQVTIVGFTGDSSMGWYRGSRRDAMPPMSELSISPRQRLDDVVRYVADLPFGPTDCALPMTWAKDQGLDFDTFVVLTDNETGTARTVMHPHQALGEYRQARGIDARQVVVGMTATDFTIADPDDPGTLDVAGFDAAVPQLIADFSRGDL